MGRGGVGGSSPRLRPIAPRSPLAALIRLLASSWAWAIAALTAATSVSASSSGSSGSIASGAISIDVITSSPLIATFTAPPPAVVSMRSFLSASCAAAISACIF